MKMSSADEMIPLIRISTTGLVIRSIGVSKKALDGKVCIMHNIRRQR